MKYHLEIITPEFVPQADMSNTPDLIEFLKAMLPKQIQSFKIRKDGADEIGEFVMNGDVIFVTDPKTLMLQSNAVRKG